MSDGIHIRPQAGPQERFCSSPADVCIYGGTSGPGKTWAVLFEAARNIHIPGFGAVLIRKTLQQIRQQGGMWDESVKLYRYFGGRSSFGNATWTFGSGAKIQFAYLDKDTDRFKFDDARIAMLGFDQLEQHTEDQFFYMLDRNSSTTKVRPYVRAGCTAVPDSWLAKFLDWWIGEDGLPIPERSGVLRWMIRDRNTNKVLWADNHADLSGYGQIPRSVTFISATIDDNQILLRKNPQAKANLEARPDRAQTLYGKWKSEYSDGIKVIDWFESKSTDPVEWIKENVWVPELRGPIQLAPYQEWCLREALSKEPDGTFRYSTIVWSDIKKSIKSTIAAAVALWRAVNTPWGQVLMVANDLKQADSRVGYYLRRSIELNPKLKDLCNTRGYKVEFPNHAIAESIPIDPTGEAGSNADMVIFSELWGSHNKAQRRMWTEMTLPPAKFGQSFRWVETYAGYEGESILLRQLYDLAIDPLLGGEAIPGSEQFQPALRAYRNPQSRLFLLWNDCPRLSWQSQEYYQEQAGILEANEFDRIHRNQWTASAESFTFPELWDACKTSTHKVIDPLDPVIVSMDAAISGDCFGVVALTRENGISEVIECRRWIPGGKKMSYEGPGGPEEYVKYLCERYNVIEVAYDEYQLHSTASRLKQELVTYFRVFSQMGDRLVADKMLKDAIRERSIRHHGEEELREHILNAMAKIEGEKIRIVKKSDKLKIDLAVCLSMAHNRAVECGL